MYHPTRQDVRCVGTFKRDLVKANNEKLSDVELQKILRVYWITPNANTTIVKSPAERVVGRWKN